jgi:cell division protein FtsW (lipid II flippase)
MTVFVLFNVFIVFVMVVIVIVIVSVIVKVKLWVKNRDFHLRPLNLVTIFILFFFAGVALRLFRQRWGVNRAFLPPSLSQLV